MRRGEPTGPPTPLAQLMIEHGLRGPDVMALSGIGQRQFMNLKSGAFANVTIAALVAVAHALGVAPCSLVPGLDVAPGGYGSKPLQLRVRARVQAQHREAVSRSRVRTGAAAPLPDSSRPIAL